MKMNRTIARRLRQGIVVCLALACVLCAACGGSNAPAPSAPQSASPSVSPELTPASANAPGAVTEAGSSNQPEQTPSPTMEEAMKIRSKVEKIKGVEDLAVIVTDTKQAVVAVVLMPEVQMDKALENQIKGAATSGIDVRVTADPGQIAAVREFEEKMYENGALPMNQVQAIWDQL